MADETPAVEISKVALPDHLSIGIAATALGVSTDTLRRWDRDGRLRAVRTPTGQRRFRRSDVEALLAQRQSESVAS